MNEIPQRRCTCCLERKPLTDEFFPHRGELERQHEFKSRCLECGRNTSFRHTSSKRIRAERSRVPNKKPCNECGDLPWRVEGVRCRACKLRYADEKLTQVADYLYRSNERVIA